MGKECVVCEKKAGLLKYRLSDGLYVCSDCVVKSGCMQRGKSPKELDTADMCKLCSVDDSKKDDYIKMLSRQQDARDAEREARATAEFLRQRSATESENQARCPKCGSTSISGDKKGYGIGKGVVGAAVAGPLGLVAGNLGAKKVRVTCLNCGHQWMAGKGK